MPSASGIGLKAELSKNRVWFGAQLFFAALITLYALTGINWLYKYGLMAVMLGLLLEIQNEIQSDQSNDVIWLKAAGTGSAPYLFLTGYLFLAGRNPTLVALLSLGIASFVKALLSVPHYPTIAQTQAWRLYGASLKDRLALNYLPSLPTLIASIEVSTTLWLLLSLFSAGPLVFLVWTTFLRWRYLVSEEMRGAVESWDRVVVGLVENPMCPKWVRRSHGAGRKFLKGCFGNGKATPTANATSPRTHGRPVSR